ncbi:MULTISPECIES: ABC transporter permease [unclassified Clostridioides]|uniref:ABC transporter permease n=1 Tax=unclassified Clostridioides TaxID=2635829 RepID=UPI001D119064|nr:FtsX-like permease family protein [Clostridioides sp. ES-S-0123-01]UDN60456.1 FtsX-like permease family protein [Clostridioides sp. ES-W-0016-02]
MNIYNIAKKNLKKNFSFYSLYLFSVAFILMIFFSFVSFSVNDIIMNKISSDGRVETMTKTISIFIISFVLFYMLYSNRFFIRRRMRELGIYTLMGYRKSSILKLVMIENIFICMIAFIIGVLAGSLLHKFIIHVIVHSLNLNVDSSKIPFFNVNAVISSILFLIVILLVLYFSNWKLIRRNSLLNLVKIERNEEKQIIIRPLIAFIGIFMLVLGYVLAFDMTRGKDSVWYSIGFSPIAILTLLCVVVGTVFFINSFLPYIIRILKTKKNHFYREIQIITIPKFIYSIRSNAKTLILLTLLSAGTLCIFASTVLSIYYPVVAVSRIVPSAIEFKLEEKSNVDKIINAVRDYELIENLKYRETNIIKVNSSSKNLPIEYSIGKDKGRISGFDCISESDYIELIKQQGKTFDLKPLNYNESVLVKYRPSEENVDKGKILNLDLYSDKKVDVVIKDTTLDNPISFSNSIGTLIVSDKLYNEISRYNNLSRNSIISIDGKDMRDNKEIYEKLKNLLKNNPYFISAYQRKFEIVHESSSTFLLISFLSVIFFIATGSMLYFHSISNAIYDRNSFNILSKIGYSQKNIKKIIKNQILVFFSIPYVLGMAHSIFGLIAYKSALIDNILGNNTPIIIPIVFASVIFTLVYIGYYILTKYSCYKIVLKK